LPGSDIIDVEVKCTSMPKFQIDGIRLNPVMKERVAQEVRDLLKGKIIEETIIDHCLPEFSRFAKLVYDQQSFLHFGDSVLHSSEGVQQGDPLGPAFFVLFYRL
jgi:hypothetical protein